MSRYQNWLKKQRAKSDVERRNIALMYSFVITGTIFFVWLVTIIYSATDLTSNQELNNMADITPANSLLSGFKSLFK